MNSKSHLQTDQWLLIVWYERRWGSEVQDSLLIPWIGVLIFRRNQSWLDYPFIARHQTGSWWFWSHSERCGPVQVADCCPRQCFQSAQNIWTRGGVRGTTGNACSSEILWRSAVFNQEGWVLIAKWENECNTSSAFSVARVMIAQWENECNASSAFSVARVMIAQRENEYSSLPILSVVLVQFPTMVEYFKGLSLVDQCAAFWKDQKLGPQLKWWLRVESVPPWKIFHWDAYGPILPTVNKKTNGNAYRDIRQAIRTGGHEPFLYPQVLSHSTSSVGPSLRPWTRSSGRLPASPTIAFCTHRGSMGTTDGIIERYLCWERDGICGWAKI